MSVAMRVPATHTAVPRLGHRRDPATAGGHMLYLAARHTVVVPYTQTLAGGWLAVVAAGNRPGLTVSASDEEVETALPVSIHSVGTGSADSGRRRRRDTGCAGGRVLHLAAHAVVVVPYSRVPEVGWMCVAVSGRRPGTQMPVSDNDIETALPTGITNPLTDLTPTVFTAVWHAQVCRRWPARSVATLADWITAHTPATTFTHDPADRIRMRAAAGLHESAPADLLRFLARARYLCRTGADRWRLTVPPLPPGPPR